MARMLALPYYPTTIVMDSARVSARRAAAQARGLRPGLGLSCATMEPTARTAFRPHLSGSTVLVDTAAGPVAVHTAGSGPPLLLVHSVNAAASAAELRPLHEHYAKTHTVFSPDLPGYGATARPDRLYTPRLMTDALHGVARHIRSQFANQAVDALALSLSQTEAKKPLGDGELSEQDLNAIQLGEGETLEQLKAKLKPKKSTISLEMLDTANSYDDKVALVRMIVAEDSSRVASVLKNMIKAG